MLKLFRNALLAVVAMLAVNSAVVAQQLPDLPVDAEVRIGTLPNGLTYYIRHNENPKGQADFYIAQKVGSILEEDNQRGLAHFLEHMCFNGTTNFPGSSLRDWLETKGVKFGANLNAYTSIDETVYNISNVPVANNTAVQDSCLLILHDWANDLTLDPAEIDSERGVIHEEWRRSMAGAMRIYENLLPIIYPNSPYGYRLPIGTMEVVDNFPPQALRDYYETWYRPDQQGIIVVGDIDVDYIEGKIKEMFSSIEMPENPKERQYFPVDDNEGIIFAIGSDPEMTSGTIDLMYKTDAFPREMKSNMAYMFSKYMTSMIGQMLTQRLSDLAKTADAPYAGADAGFGNFFVAKTKDALDLSVTAKDDDILKGYEAAYRELLRAARGGFTVGEYERARNEYISRLEKAYNSRETRQSGSYVNEYVRHFLDNEPIPSIEDEYNIMNQFAQMIPVEAINQILPEVMTEDNRVILVMAPQNDTYHVPTEAEITAVMAKVEAENIEPYVDAVKTEPLIPELPAPGKVVSVADDAQWGAKVLTLSNGVKVVVKPTDLKKDEIRFEAIAKGGTSTLPEDKAVDIQGMTYVLMMNGLGDYTNSDLTKYLQGKQVGVDLSLDDYNRELSGSSTVKDLQTLFELIYMHFINVNITEDEFAAMQNLIANQLTMQESAPQFQFAKNLQKSLYASAVNQLPTAEMVKNVDRMDVLNMIHSLVANAADYTFFFVGDIDMETITPLIEQYIATLPADAATASKDYTVNLGREVRGGSFTDTYTTQMQTPQTFCNIIVEGELPYDAKNRQVASIAAQILSNRLIKKIREEMGAVYSIGASGTMTRQGKYNALLQIQFPMKPEMKQEVLDEIRKMIVDMETNVADDELQPIVEYMVKSVGESKEQNSGWIGSMSATELNGVDIFNGIEDVLKAVTTADVQNYIKALMDQDNYSVVILDPEVTD